MRTNYYSKFILSECFSPIWQSCSDSAGNIVLDGAVEGLEDSNGCYSSFEDDWDDCNDNGCEDNFQIDSDDDNDDGDDDDDNEVATTATPLIRVSCSSYYFTTNSILNF